MASFARVDDNNIVIGNCGHAFHSGCINTWLVQNTTCPLCCETWSIFKEPTTPPLTSPSTPPPNWSESGN